ncbi:hypothetical protein M3Y97_00262300 [Aphelenchoides bicaudatus]|nr:hypothetical protein M3Y97_00262300 [Aphelenchoides bicaudatus]
MSRLGVLGACLIILCATLGESTLCVVTKWTDWSECTGTCNYGLQVRNRNVLRPPFPEIDPKTGDQRLRPCPELYETRKCVPTECLSKEQVELTTTTTTQKPSVTPALNELFRDLPIIRSVISDTAKSPFESEKTISLSRPNQKKFVEPVPTTRRPAIQHPLRRISSQAHRPNCTLEMNAQCCRLVRDPVSKWRSACQTHSMVPTGEQLCRPFHYPHCSDSLEKVEKPLVTESSCLQKCFSEYEQAILPSLRII